MIVKMNILHESHPPPPPPPPTHHTKPHHTTPHRITPTKQQHLRPKDSKESKSKPQTDIDKPAGPQGCVKSKSYIKPKVIASGSPTFSILYKTPKFPIGHHLFRIQSCNNFCLVRSLLGNSHRNSSSFILVLSPEKHYPRANIEKNIYKVSPFRSVRNE